MHLPIVLVWLAWKHADAIEACLYHQQAAGLGFKEVFCFETWNHVNAIHSLIDVRPCPTSLADSSITFSFASLVRPVVLHNVARAGALCSSGAGS